LPVVNVPPPGALVPSRPKPKTVPLPEDVRANRFAFAALARAAARIARAHQGQRHPALVATAYQLAELIDRRMLRESDVRAALISAARMAGIDEAGPGRDAEREASAVLAWALQHRRR
jgi:hypothetical protein